MKTIITSGKIKVVRFNCNECGCVFESDEYTKSGSVGDINRVKTDSCPTCKVGVNK
jgi:hypothetical protein